MAHYGVNIGLLALLVLSATADSSGRPYYAGSVRSLLSPSPCSRTQSKDTIVQGARRQDADADADADATRIGQRPRLGLGSRYDSGEDHGGHGSGRYRSAHGLSGYTDGDYRSALSNWKSYYRQADAISDSHRGMSKWDDGYDRR